MKALIMVLVLGIASWCFAGEKRQYEISPRFEGIRGNHGLLKPGTDTNPYTVKENGEEIGVIKPKHGFRVNEKMFGKPGSDENPWVIEIED